MIDNSSGKPGVFLAALDFGYSHLQVHYPEPGVHNRLSRVWRKQNSWANISQLLGLRDGITDGGKEAGPIAPAR